ncbi:hypothetical protein SPAB_04103 [Salmonella enterica subsp. enterica serovar Paratyphi B str. SPB7]|uniref:Uncharacterized protein n=1 Tax=Salmonella paratyphi B (strain ATCC BAA-1250 / SPB7) TaxID=1016998 RepID=A0A6C6Z6C7_SALPB|nr:hypothetical protein SPAB_04103 [Salmonella enterica subsp. enterica serovar Paratyphi B str. SPB7]
MSVGLINVAPSWVVIMSDGGVNALSDLQTTTNNRRK